MRVPSSYTLRKSRGLRMRELFGNARVSEELSLGSEGLGDSFGVADDPFVANGELPASALPAASQNRAAIHCLHAGAEAVLLRTLTVIRLKSSLRHISEYGPVSKALLGDPTNVAQKRTGLCSQVKSLRTTLSIAGSMVTESNSEIPPTAAVKPWPVHSGGGITSNMKE